MRQKAQSKTTIEPSGRQGTNMPQNIDIESLKRSRHRRFMAKGLAFAIASGICYGLYTAFLTLAETQGTWGEWFSGSVWNGNAPLSAFTVTFALAALAAGINDLFSGIWALIVCAKNGQMRDLRKTVKTKPGRIMILCAAIGGPFATIAYVIALNSATTAGNPGIIVPIAALNCAIGTVLGRIFSNKSSSLTKSLAYLFAWLPLRLSAAAVLPASDPKRCLAACLHSSRRSDGASKVA